MATESQPSFTKLSGVGPIWGVHHVGREEVGDAE